MFTVSPLVHLARHGEIAVVTIENPPVNALSPGVAEGIRDCVVRAAADPEATAIVVIGGGSTFIAGADIKEFTKVIAGGKLDLNLAEIVREIEDSPKPVIIALHGSALGGGLEVAMGGHYRVIAPKGLVGQPEVKIGLIPGGAGTQRLPRLAGIAKALDMCVRGEPIGAKEALEFGIVDRIIEGDLLAGAIAFASEVADQPIVRTRDRAVKGDAPPTKPSPAATAVLAAATMSFDDGCRLEREIFEQCLHSTECKALIHAFFGERTVAKIPDIPKDTPVAEIRRAAVVGAGTMGGGIAMTYANAGIPVILKETTQDALDSGFNIIRANYANSVKKGRFSQQEMDRRLELITPQLSYDGFEEADIIIEAVFENMQLKKRIFSQIDALAKPDSILATNTSTLDIDEIAAATSRPEMVVGHHFFSPANVMKLLEVVRGKQTSKAVIATSMALGKKLKKIAVLAGNCPGFIGNRMIHVYVREAQLLVEEGASVEEVNDALTEFGMAMGPLAMCDLAGIDVSWRIRQESKHTEKPGERQPLVADKLYELGRFGQKTGRGWSMYDADRKPSPDPETAALIEQIAGDAGIARRKIERQEIVDRCILSLINEGTQILDEGIALRSVDIDVVYLNGYGFPRTRGGPMFYADTLGLPEVAKRVEALGWHPTPLLARLAAEGKTFSE